MAEEADSSEDINLYQTLYELFTVSAASDDQKAVLVENWHRIYTTNYDDLVEFCRPDIARRSYSYSDPLPKRFDTGSVVHLHGSIRYTTEQNVLEQLVLDETSYVAQHFNRSPWYDEFIRDLRFCDAIYFVGYSLSDYHISALLLQNPAFAAKTFFITGGSVDPIFRNRVSKYGTILDAGTKEFANTYLGLPRPAPVSELHSLKALRYIDPFKDKKTLKPPTAIEILNLVSFGTFNFQRCLSSLPDAEYVVPRRDLVGQAEQLVNSNRSLLVNARLGNGKSIFLYLLAFRLAESGYKTFRFSAPSASMLDEVRLIAESGKSVLFFEDYDQAIEVMPAIKDAAPNCKFVVLVRTGTQEVRQHEIGDHIAKPIATLSLNTITDQDREDFSNILDSAGIGGAVSDQALKISRDIRDFVLYAYKNEAIERKIQSEIQPILDSPSAKMTFVASHLFRFVGQPIEAGFLRALTGQDPYVALGGVGSFGKELFKIDGDGIQVRSGVLAEHILHNHVDADYVLDVAFRIVSDAEKHRHERRFRALSGNLMQFSTLARLLKAEPQRDTKLETFYDRLRRDINVNMEPLFWLQYSIFMMSINRLEPADEFIQTAYERAEEMSGFRTYQIDTHALRLWLRIETASTSTNIEKFDVIVERMNAVGSMIGDASHRNHAIDVLADIEPFVTARSAFFSVGEKNILVYQLNRLRTALGALDEDKRARSGSDNIKAGIERAIDILLQ